MTSPELSAALVAVREAREVLDRASAECWHNGNARAEGPLHWSAAVPAARAALDRALAELEALERDRSSL